MSFSGSPKGATRPQTGVGGTVQENRRSFGADFLRNHYFGGVLESAGGGVAVPLVDESGGGFVDGLDWSAGGGVLCIEFELESGAAGAVVEESEGALGAVDCCFEHATIASALRHNKRRLRFIDHLTVYLSICWISRPRLTCAGWDTTLGRKQRSVAAFPGPGKLEATATRCAPDMLRPLAMLLGK